MTPELVELRDAIMAAYGLPDDCIVLVPVKHADGVRCSIYRHHRLARNLLAFWLRVDRIQAERATWDAIAGALYMSSGPVARAAARRHGRLIGVGAPDELPPDAPLIADHRARLRVPRGTEPKPGGVVPTESGDTKHR